MDAGEATNPAPAPRPLLTWGTVMREAFIAARPSLARKRAGLRRLPAWTVLRQRRR